MGMDFNFCGSATYRRFNDEMKKIVELFGGAMITQRKPASECTMLEFFMEKPLEYEFKEETPKAFMKWANNPYGKFTLKETKEVYTFLKTKWRKVEEISPQIAQELEDCCQYKCAWSIN